MNYYPVDDVHKLIGDKGKSIEKIGVVFGCEDFGLLNKEIERCDVMTYIPMAQSHPSLNLAQAVMIYGFLLSNYAFHAKRKRPQNRKDAGQYRVLKKRASSLLESTDIRKNGVFYNKIMKRLALLGQKDIQLVHFLINRLEEKLT
jgi:tRNA/rRNA methyltransferase